MSELEDSDPDAPEPPARFGLRLSRSQMARVSHLLDEALMLDEAGRRRWLDTLPEEYEDIAPGLREVLLLRNSESLVRWATLPKIAIDEHAHFASAAGLAPGARIGPYELIRLLGSGGMAAVWLARRADGAFRREIALKLPLQVHLRPDLEARFAREREILAALIHPNIARLYDAGVSQQGQPYLALEYVAGTPLTSYCDSHRLTLRQRLEIFAQVLGAVQYAHANLIIHRDLKPSNILVNEEGQVRLLDFGIAKLLSEGEAKETELTRLSGRALTPEYAAPEQVGGAAITTAADVYALGVILYETLTGVRPYRLTRDSRGALEDAILTAEPVAPSRSLLSESAAQARATSLRRLAWALRGELDTIVLKALKKSPRERYQAANAFGADIARFLRGEAVLAQPDSFAYRSAKFLKRYRAGLAVAAAMFLTLAGGFAGTAYEARIAAAQAHELLEAQMRTLAQTAAARVKDGDVASAMGIILDILEHQGAKSPYSSEAIGTFQEARAMDALVGILVGHGDQVRSAAFSPDGQRIITASVDRTARIWDAMTGRQTLVLTGHTAGVTAAAFSPDGRRVVTASRDNTARIWDAVTGRQLLLIRGHAQGLRSAAFSADGQRVVTASFDKTARIWDASTGGEIMCLRGHTDRVTAATFSPDGRRVATASEDKTARIWDARSGRQLMVLVGHTDRVWSVAFSPNGRRLITASNDGTARIWDVATGLEIRQFRKYADEVTSATFSPDGKAVVTASNDRSARIWDVATGREIRELRGHTMLVESAAFSPDGGRVVTGSFDKTARIWDLGTGVLMTLRGHDYQIQSTKFSPDGKRIVTTSEDGTARIWDAATGQQLQVLRHPDLVKDAVFSPDGRRLATISNERKVHVWDATTGREVMTLGGLTEWAETVEFSPDGARILVAADDKTAHIWDAATGAPLVLLTGHTDKVNDADFSPDGRRVVTASNDRTARIWDMAAGGAGTLVLRDTYPLASAQFFPDGRRVVTQAEGGVARVWDATTGLELMSIQAEPGDQRVALSPDGRQLMRADMSDTARIWDTRTGLEIRRLKSFTTTLATAQFSPDGRRIVIGQSDNAVGVWDARTVPLEAQISWARAAQFEPLSKSERSDLGLLAATDPLPWPIEPSKCDQLAAAVYDPDRRAPGVALDQLEVPAALAACSHTERRVDDVRSLYQHGRALMARGNFAEARSDFEQAVVRGYRSARIDLGMLLTQRSAGMLDPARAISLYEQAWREGVAIAAFELGDVYEHGVSAGSGNSEPLLRPDSARAWIWYQTGADAGEPASLARLAERRLGESSLDEIAAQRKSLLLESFKYYCAAAERARTEAWPIGSWMKWRYQRASLARFLARAGMMQQVAEVYDQVQRQYGARPATLRERLSSLWSRAMR